MQYTNIDCFGTDNGAVTPESLEETSTRVQRAKVVPEITSAMRRAFLENTVAYCTTHLEQLSKKITAATGRVVTETYIIDILPVVTCARYLLDTLGSTEISVRKDLGFFSMEGRYREVSMTPAGVVVAAVPWNLPFSIPLMIALRAVADGNAAVIKCSPKAAGMFLVLQDMIAELCMESGLSTDTVQIIIGDETHTEILLNEQPDSCIFVGQTAHGREVAKFCADRLIPHTLELSARNHAIVLPDADGAHAARGISWGAFFANGQSCAAVSIVHVPVGVYEVFLTELERVVCSLRLGNPHSALTDIGSLSNAADAKVIEGLLEKILTLPGARVVVGGATVTKESLMYFEPTIVSLSSEVSCGSIPEILGPVLCVVPYATEQEAMQKVLADKQCMHTSLWSRDVGKASDIAQQLRTKQIFINDTAYTYAVPDVPWDGVGLSGYGTIQQQGVPEIFRRVRSVNVTPYNKNLSNWWYPYSEQHVYVGMSLIRGVKS